MSLASDADERTAWLTFANVPSVYIDPARLRSLLGGGVSIDICEQLKASPRVRSRLSALIAAQYQIPPVGEEPLQGADTLVALTSSAQLSSIVERAGAIYWSGTLSSVVRREEVAEVQSKLGEDLYQFAIRHHALTGPKQLLEPLDTLRKRINSDGWHCYAAWCEEVAPAISARARLKAPPGRLDTPPVHFKDFGPELIRQAAT